REQGEPIGVGREGAAHGAADLDLLAETDHVPAHRARQGGTLGEHHGVLLDVHPPAAVDGCAEAEQVAADPGGRDVEGLGGGEHAAVDFTVDGYGLRSGDHLTADPAADHHPAAEGDEVTF